jgi:hypothetical protein
MTIPATDDYFLVQNIFGLETGLPEDVIVNTFCFRNDLGSVLPGTPEDRASTAVVNFFKEATTPSGALAGAAAGSIIGIMPNNVTSWSQKVYDLGAPPGGRAPVSYDLTSQMPPRSSAARLPHEVAVCLSLQTPVIGRRGRGRLFLGPFVNAVGENKPGGLAVTEAWRKRFAHQASVLAAGNGVEMQWAIWSTTRSQFENVVGAYVDDAFDTQRRRGTKATVRTQWGQTMGTEAA